MAVEQPWTRVLIMPTTSAPMPFSTTRNRCSPTAFAWTLISMLFLRTSITSKERYPSHARMWVAPIRSREGDQKMSDYNQAMEEWYNFVDKTKTYYGVDMSIFAKPFSEEQRKYYLQTSLWNNLHPSQVIGAACIIKEIDCSTATIDDIADVRASISTEISAENTRLCGFAGWFDVHFQGSMQNPAEQEIELTTAPSEDFGTHWGQQVFLIHPPLSVGVGDELITHMSMNRSEENHRLMEVEFGCEIRHSSGKLLPPFRNKFYME